ncbi:hypothetical protein Veis_1573 [Verminephrobacter eiseniae EF01-2]|uniref:Uncharacterized protein n=1 Tax=Verminephrobacter eiseniae (strain EF01-2) TaxID=391735 RepID=A1WI75_VEREI|nr:hypothetical protein Veis_1573 [Verminephrobacter eiseniae EF01-2]
MSQAAHVDEQQAGRSRADAPASRRHDRPADLRHHRLAGAHGARRVRRAFKKKLGLTLVSDKQPVGERVYRMA